MPAVTRAGCFDGRRVSGVRDDHEPRAANRRGQFAPPWPARWRRLRRRRSTRVGAVIRRSSSCDAGAIDDAVDRAPDVATLRHQSRCRLASSSLRVGSPRMVLPSMIGATARADDPRTEHAHDVREHPIAPDVLDRLGVARRLDAGSASAPGRGVRAAIRIATKPPIDRPTKCTGPGARCSSSATASCRTSSMPMHVAVVARALALAAVIPRDAAIARAQRRDLRREQRRVPQQAVAEHDGLARRARPGIDHLE